MLLLLDRTYGLVDGRLQLAIGRLVVTIRRLPFLLLGIGAHCITKMV